MASVGGAVAEGLRSGFEMGRGVRNDEERKREFEAEQAARDLAQQRLAKQEDDRYGRMNDQARVQAAEQRLATLQKLSDAAIAAGHQPPDSVLQERAQLMVQIEDMQSQIQTTGRLAPVGAAAPVAAPRANVASADTSPAAPDPTPAPAIPTAGVSAALGAPAPTSPAPTPQPTPDAMQQPAPGGVGSTLGPQRGPAGVAPAMDAASAAPVGLESALPGAPPPAAAVSSPVSSAVTPTQKIIADTDQRSQDLASRLNTGQLSLADVKPGDFALMVASATKRPPGELDQVRQHIADWQSGMATQNDGLTLQGLNGIFSNQISQGVGSPSPYGGTITGKSVIGLDPAMSADGTVHADKVIPRLQITTDVKGADGQPLTYHAPMTLNRTSDPGDPVTAIPMADAVNHIGAMGALVEAASHPDAQALLQKGSSDPRIAQYLDAIKAGAQPADPVAQKQAVVDKYSKLWGTDNEDTVARLVQLGYLKPVPQTKGTVAQTMDAAQQLVDSGSAPDLPSALKMLQAGGVTKQPSKYSGGGGGVAGAVGVAGNGGAVQTGPGGKLTPQTVDWYATQSIMGDNSWQVGLGRGKVGQQLIAAVKDRIPQMAGEMGLDAQDVGTNKAQYAALTKTLADRTKYVTSVEQLNNNLLSQTQLVQNLLAKGGATEAGPLFNAPYNKVREALGSVDAHNLDVALTGLAREHQRVLTSPMSNGQLAVSAAATGDRLASLNLTPSQIMGTLDTMRQESANGLANGRSTLDSVQSQLRGLGRAKGTPGVTPPTAAGTGLNAAPVAAGGAPTQIHDAAGYAALPSGAHYLDPNGVARIKQ